MRRLVRPALNLAILCGVGIALWPVGQYAYATWNQRELSSQWKGPASVTKHTKKSAKNGAIAKNEARVQQRHDPNSPVLASVSTHSPKKAAWSLTKLSIPDIGLETFVVQGMDAASLRRGPGHDVNSSPLGQGNCVIAGHRNVYGSYFYRLDELSPGSSIRLENRDGAFDYTVEHVYITPDTNLTVIQPPPAGSSPLLTLITCTLPHTNNRLIVQAILSQNESTP